MPAKDSAEQSRRKRDRRVANGKCPGCGKDYVPQVRGFVYCFLCRQKNSKNNKIRHDKLRKLQEDNELAFKLLNYFKGATLIERARNANKYYEAVEGALV